jgi:predicted HicB family RNase H-like nuclease
MTDPKDAEKSDDSQVSRRRRVRTYGDRRTLSLRIDPDLHERLIDLCDELRIPANTYISGLIDSDLKRRKK